MAGSGEVRPALLAGIREGIAARGSRHQSAKRSITPFHCLQDFCSGHPEQTHHCSRTESSRGIMWLQARPKNSGYDCCHETVTRKKSALSKTCYSTLSSSIWHQISPHCQNKGPLWPHPGSSHRWWLCACDTWRFWLEVDAWSRLSISKALLSHK